MCKSFNQSLNFSRSVAAATGVLCIAFLIPNWAQAQEHDAQAAIDSVAKELPQSPFALSGSLGLSSDYRFRGISQTWRGAVVQGGVELALPQGWYLGTWLSNVSSNSYPQGQSLEHDLYAGWRGDVLTDWKLDAGLLHYRYPGARLNAADGSAQRFDTTEAYLGATHGGFNVKWSVAMTPYFGLRESTTASAFATALTPAGSSRGSQYLDLNYQYPLGDWATLGLHAGYTHVRNYSEVSYADWRVSLAKTWGVWTASAAWVGTSADTNYYSAVNSQGRMRSLGRSGLVLGLSAAF